MNLQTKLELNQIGDTVHIFDDIDSNIIMSSSEWEQVIKDYHSLKFNMDGMGYTVAEFADSLLESLADKYETSAPLTIEATQYIVCMFQAISNSSSNIFLNIVDKHDNIVVIGHYQIPLFEDHSITMDRYILACSIVNVINDRHAGKDAFTIEEAEESVRDSIVMGNALGFKFKNPLTAEVKNIIARVIHTRSGMETTITLPKWAYDFPLFQSSGNTFIIPPHYEGMSDLSTHSVDALNSN